VKIINRTHFRTDDLRRIISRVASTELEAWKRKRMVVGIGYCRKKGEASGCAPIGGSECMVRINKHDPDPAAFALVVRHEFRHCNGWTHQRMKAFYSEEDVKRYHWAHDLGIRRLEPKRKARPDAGAKLAHAERMLQQAITRQKRATTIAKKWAAKVRYYSKKQQALPQAATRMIHSISRGSDGEGEEASG
jgi:hypothetical protein